MMELENARADSFVLLKLAERRFALPADRVAELAPPVRLHQFPHTSRLLAGVIVRRGKILPVYDAARALSGKSSFSHRFYLVVRRAFGESAEMSAIPVEGECELITGEVRPVREAAPAYICGEISVGSESIGVLDIEAFVRLHEASAAGLPEVRA